MKKSDFSLSSREWHWIFYDWANSAFSTTIVAGFFPIFFKQYWANNLSPTQSSHFLGSTHSIVGLILAISSPILGSLIDRVFSKRKTLMVLTFFATLLTSIFYFIPQGEWLQSLILFGSIQFLFGQCLVVYDSLLTEVASSQNLQKVSSFGYAFGYLGGGILFAINVGLYLNFQSVGIENAAEAIKLNFVSVALWWLIFALPLLFQADLTSSKTRHNKNFESIFHPFQSFTKTLKKIYAQHSLRYFLFAYFLYIDGVNTIIAMAVDYGMAIGLSSQDLIKALLIVQFVGFPATFFTLKLSEFFSTKTTIFICILVYGFITAFATQMSSSVDFMILATAIGMVQGGIQALSRSYFAQMIPKSASGEYFGFFNLLTKFSTILGPILMGWAALYFQNSRLSILVLLVLFCIGGFFLTLSRPHQE